MKWQRSALVFAAFIFLWALGSYDLWAPDEPFFAEGAREMLRDGKWAVPHINGSLNTHKPAFFFWLIALASLPMDQVSSWSARLPSAVAGLGTILLILSIGRRYYGERTAALAAVVLATVYLFWDKARSAQIDATLCFFIWLALFAFMAWRAGQANGRRAGILLWVATAFAVLAKGPVGLLLVVGIVVVTLAWDRNMSALKNFAPLLGPVIFTLIVGAWMLYATIGSNGAYSVWGALQEHVISRGVHGMHHKQPIWYFAKMLPVLLFPWTGLALGAVVLAWRRRSHSIDRFLLVAAGFVVVFFTISTEKRGLYLLPAMPAFSLMIARLLAAVMDWNEERFSPPPKVPLSRRWVSLAQGITGAFLVLVGAAIPFIGQKAPEIPTSTSVILGLTLAISGLVVLVMTLRGQAALSALPLAGGMAAAYLIAVTLIYPTMEPRKSARSFALELKEITADSRAQGHSVLACGMANVPTAIAFYSDGVYTVTTNDPADLERHLMQEAEVFAATNVDLIEQLNPQARERIQVLSQTRLSRRDIVLISNRGEAVASPRTAPATALTGQVEDLPPPAKEFAAPSTPTR